jgi:RNA methyltransferase, TrmH family
MQEDHFMPLTKARIRDLQNLGRKKEREVTGLFIVDGLRGVREAVHSCFPVREMFYTEELLADEAGSALVADARKRVSSIQQITPREMEQISDTVTAQGVVAVMQQLRWELSEQLQRADKPSVIMALDAVADPGNLGSIIRTCDWFGVDALLLGRNCVEPYNPKVVRSTVGSIFHIPVVPDVDLVPTLSEARKCGYTVYAAAADGNLFADAVKYPTKLVCVLGNEAWGVSEAVMASSDAKLAIRRHGAAESLNVGTACAVILADIRRQLC